MIKSFKIGCVFIMCFCAVQVIAQEAIETFENDSIHLEEFPQTIFEDEVVLVAGSTETITLMDETVDPTRTIWLGTIIPGYGQIANKKYWKLPIVYGGFLGCFYAINWNASQYTTYKNAYLDITDDDDSTNSHLEIIPEGYTMESYGGKNAYTGMLKSGMEKARYNRDLSVIISVAYYGLTLVDAFVDAHLADFDVSTDLSMKIKPTLLHDNFAQTYFSKRTYGIGLSAVFKF